MRNVDARTVRGEGEDGGGKKGSGGSVDEGYVQSGGTERISARGARQNDDLLRSHEEGMIDKK